MNREVHVPFWESAGLRCPALLAYLKGYMSVGELTIGLTEYFGFYNTERPHQSLNNLTPDAVYRSGRNGGAMIVDKFSGKKKTKTQTTVETGQRRPAACSERITA